MKNRGKWKKMLAAALGIFCILQINPMKVSAADYWPEAPETLSPSIIVMEASTGTVLYEKNSEEVHYPASITKILTTLIVLENADLNEVVTFSDASIDETEGSGIARDYGEQMTVEQCLYAVMLESANECAYAVAEHVAGSMDAFVDMMNAKVMELGCTNTHFANPHGLHDEDHYTTCKDMALIAQAAYQNETFRIITGTKIYTIPPTNKHEEETILRNHQEMLVPYRSTKYVYENCVGGKTGYTDAARSTLVTFAEKDGMNLICVVMNTESPNQWTDTTNLFDYCFDNFQALNIAENETEFTADAGAKSGSLNTNDSFVELDDTAVLVLPKTAEFTDAKAVISYNDEVSNVAGTISYTYAGREVGSADIKTTGVMIQGYVFDNQKPENIVEEEAVSTVKIKPMQIVFIVIAVILLIFLVIIGKWSYDNFYIIRHNMMVRRNRREQYRIKRNSIRKRRRRR